MRLARWRLPAAEPFGQGDSSSGEDLFSGGVHAWMMSARGTGPAWCIWREWPDIEVRWGMSDDMMWPVAEQPDFKAGDKLTISMPAPRPAWWRLFARFKWTRDSRVETQSYVVASVRRSTL